MTNAAHPAPHRPPRAAAPRLLGALTLGLALGMAATTDVAALELEPVGPGPYSVACSNVDQDFSRAAGPVSSYWEGSPDVSTRYVTELLVSPQYSVRYTVTPPDDRDLFAKHRNRAVDYVALVCYPTPADNPRAPLFLPDGGIVPAMQRGSEPPLIADTCSATGGNSCDRPTRWPLLLYSHGLSGSPLSDSYLETIVRFASHGYIVAAPFHADPRFSRVTIEDLDDLAYLYYGQNELAEMQAIRPLAMQALLGHLLADATWGTRIDAERIAGFGASMGGETMMLLAGAELTYNLTRSRKQVVYEPRLKAVVTFVPYSGVDILPAFGDDQRGTNGLMVSYLGIGGSEDLIAPVNNTKKALERMMGTRYLIEVEGMKHGSNPAVMDEAYAWYLTFLDANLNGDRSALSRLYRATAVAGGTHDTLKLAVQTGVAPLAGESVVREFHHAILNHFFLTANEDEANGLLAHPEWGWQATGLAFAAAPAGTVAPGVHQVCRFYGDPVIGPDSHFFTGFADECAGLIAQREQTPAGQPAWNLEGIGFAAVLPDADGNCPDSAPFPVWRGFNGHGGELVNGVRIDPNHRYSIDPLHFVLGPSAGWRIEGKAFCSPAPLRVATTAP